ncbi:hypothetical protein C0J52_00560 [Blattella germanica]|nr:hypothetical protein C0J52_00560 [Blattella germanica]
MRMAPAMGMQLLLEATLTNRFGSGPKWKAFAKEAEDGCRNDWWKHMLFINNWWGLEKFLISLVLWIILFVIVACVMLTVHPFIQFDYQYNAIESAFYLSATHVVISAAGALFITIIWMGYGVSGDKKKPDPQGVSTYGTLPEAQVNKSEGIVNDCFVLSEDYENTTENTGV